MSLWPIYDAIGCPTLVVRGAGVRPADRETADEMGRRGPQGQLVEVPGVGHAPTLMDPAQIAPIRDFLLAGGGRAMSGAWLSAFSLPDWGAMAWFWCAGWVMAGSSSTGRWAARAGCSGSEPWFRLEVGARRCCAADNRMADVALIGNLMQNVSFYANTTIYVIAGLLACSAPWTG